MRAIYREGQAATVPIGQMTTYELKDLRQALEEILALDTLPPYTRSRAELQQELAEVIAEQAERARIADARA